MTVAHLRHFGVELPGTPSGQVAVTTAAPEPTVRRAVRLGGVCLVLVTMAAAGCANGPWSRPAAHGVGGLSRMGPPAAPAGMLAGAPGHQTLLPPTAPPVVRGQAPGFVPQNQPTPGSNDYWRLPMQPAGDVGPAATNVSAPINNWPIEAAQPFNPQAVPPQGFLPQGPVPPAVSPLPLNPPPYAVQLLEPIPPSVDLDVYVQEARTGRFVFGMGVNSDLGVTGQIIVDERNFDWRAVPYSWDDVWNGRAFRGGGQGFRIEAMPGTQVQNYRVSFTQPYLHLGAIPTPFSFGLNGFFYDRNYFDWDEQRVGGRASLGYRVTPDLSLIGAVRMEDVKIHNPRVTGLVPELDRVVGHSDLFAGIVTLTHDTRDTAFAPTEGHYIELSYTQGFGSFDYPRAEIDYRQHFLVRERPDGSGRSTLSYIFQFGFSGAQTPLYENYFAGGYSTLRGFDFRGASPVGAAGVVVGGEFRFLGSVEYMFPITADDMLRAVVFCDYGTVEEHIELNSENYRVSPGAGLRISIPAMGPAPLALDFAVPLHHAATDDLQNFSFFFGFSR